LHNRKKIPNFAANYFQMMTNELTKTLERVKGIPAAYTFVTGHRGRAIDLLLRTFCTPFADDVLTTSFTCNDFLELAEVNHVSVKTIDLDANFQLSADMVLSACNEHTRMLWLSMPNMLTGNNNMVREELDRLMKTFHGIVVVDETLADYSRQRPLRYELPKYPRLVVLDVPGLIFSQPANIALLRKLQTLYEYEGKTLETLPDPFDTDRRVRLCVQERNRMMDAFRELPLCQRVYASDADFFLVSMQQSDRIADYLRQRGISIEVLPLPGILRIPVGTRNENNEMVGALRQL